MSLHFLEFPQNNPHYINLLRFLYTTNSLTTMLEKRFEYIFTPKHSSWLNMIESFFRKLTKQRLSGIRVNLKEELRVRVYQYFDVINPKPSIYDCRYKLDEVDVVESVGN